MSEYVNPTTDAELVELCAEWQKVLRLQDWTVQVRFVRQFDLHHTQQGNCSPSVNKKMAQIRIVTPSDYDNPEWPQDVEKTLVHELLHLHTMSFTEEQPSKYPLMLEEHMVDALALAFVGLKRKCLAAASSSPAPKLGKVRRSGR